MASKNGTIPKKHADTAFGAVREVLDDKTRENPSPARIQQILLDEYGLSVTAGTIAGYKSCIKNGRLPNGNKLPPLPPRDTQNRKKCPHCGGLFASRGIYNHIQTCPSRHAAAAEAEAMMSGKPEPIKEEEIMTAQPEKVEEIATTQPEKVEIPSVRLDTLQRVKNTAAVKFGGVQNMLETWESIRLLASDVGGEDNLRKLLDILG